MPTVYDFEADTIGGQRVSLAQYRGRPILIVNTASACGFTPQFGGLEQLHQAYGGRGLVVLGFPCNQFGAQDPGSNEEIASFCQLNYGVSFPMMAKVEVNGDDAHPVWQWLTSEHRDVPADRIAWNFTKFLIGRGGEIVRRYEPKVEPAAIADDIEKALAS